MISATQDTGLSSSNQDDWINMLDGMEQYLGTDGIVDGITLNSPALNSICPPQTVVLSELSLSEAAAPSTTPSTKQVEAQLNLKEQDAPSGQPSREGAPVKSQAQSRPLSKASTGRNTHKNVEPKKNEISAEARAQARSERKRTREKQRRLDVNSQIVDLTSLLLKVEADEAELSGGPSKGHTANIPSNRVDLISRTISVLSRIHTENKKRGIEIRDLKSQIDEMKRPRKAECRNVMNPSVSKAQTPDPVYMMVPMMVSQDNMGAPNFMTQAIQMPMAMQMCQQMYPQQAAFPTMMPQQVASQKPQVMYYPQTPQAPAPVMNPNVTALAPAAPVQQTPTPLPVQNPVVLQKPPKANDVQKNSFTTVAFDSSQINLNVGGNLAHCA